MDLSKLIIGESDSLTVWIEYKEGMRFKVKYISRKTLTNLSKACLVWKYNEKTKVREQVIDSERFSKEFCAKAVVDWEGISIKALSKILPLNTVGMSEEEKAAPIPFSQSNLLVVVKESYDLDTLLQDSAVDIKIFRPDLENEMGNSPSSQTGT